MAKEVYKQGASNSSNARNYEVQVVVQGSSSKGQTNSNANVMNDEIYEHCLPLHRAMVQGDWDNIQVLLDINPEATCRVITPNMETVLHLGVVTLPISQFKELLIRVPPEALLAALSTVNDTGENVLHYAAYAGKLEAAKVLVEKSPGLTNKSTKGGLFPIHYAAMYKHKEVFLYLLKETENHESNSQKAKDNEIPSPFADNQGAILIMNLIQAKLVDVALKLVRKYPNLAVRHNHWPLLSLSSRASYFSSGTQYGLWERIVYKWIPVDRTITMLSTLKRSDPKRYEKVQTRSFQHYVCTPIRFLRSLFSAVPEVKRVHEEKQLHLYSLELLRFMCKEISKLPHKKFSHNFLEPIISAAELGIKEVVEEILVAYPTAIYFKENKEGMNIILLAIKNRQHNVFNLLFQMTRQNVILSYRDIYKNNILHTVAMSPPTHRLNMVPGAALQMQRELQWYKAVERFSVPYQSFQENIDKKQPSILFTEEHKDLVENGEKWMRETANSCTIAAALIATIAFAAGITVPGGVNGATGFPVFTSKTLFLIFSISNGLSLFTSVSSLIMFLSLLTARYSQADFLYSLPRKLIFGLATLFLSITFMMLTFSITIFFMYENGKMWIMGPLSALGVLPVSLFVFLQFPLLVEITSSTYGHGIFYKQGSQLLF